MPDNTTRRTFNQSILTAGAGIFALDTAFGDNMIQSIFNGVRIGVQSYSFRDRPLDQAIEAMKSVGLGFCELWPGHYEPGRENRGKPGARELLRAYRLETPLSKYDNIGQQFKDAGIDLYALNYNFRDDFTDPEIERGFEIAKALGARVLTASATVSVASRVNKYAKSYNMLVGMHNHSRIRENEYATPDDFAKASEGNSHIAVNLDIGHFVAAGFDPIDYIKKHHDRIIALHIKDRKSNQGPNVVFGEGDTPIKEVLQLLRENNYDIPAHVEYEYRGTDTVAEVRKCFEYCKQAVGS